MTQIESNRTRSTTYLDSLNRLAPTAVALGRSRGLALLGAVRLADLRERLAV